jgi:tetratricopeptide (TPR) repeat protein
MKRASLICFSIVIVGLLFGATLLAQGSGQMLFGDLIVDESKAEGLKPLTFDVILYSDTGILVARQSTPGNGRYRFNNLNNGVYQLVVEMEGTEITRIRVDLRSPLLRDLRQDIALEWRSSGSRSKPSFISAADTYVRSAANQLLFNQADGATNRKKYDLAVKLLQQILKSDARDFQVWAELANVHFLQKNFTDAENEYLTALDTHPGFFLALLNLGRLELLQKRHDVAIEALTKALKTRPDSADANYLLGEAYLQVKRGSIAVVYLKEALRLDPQGLAEVHLRLALLYNRAGMKDKAATEYIEFLKRKPDYPDRRKLERYIAQNARKS